MRCAYMYNVRINDPRENNTQPAIIFNQPVNFSQTIIPRHAAAGRPHNLFFVAHSQRAQTRREG